MTIENDTIVVLEGRKVTLHCLRAGFPSPNVSWIDFSNNVVKEGGILKFPNINRHKNGSYTCSATNVCGSDRKKVDIVVECESMSTLKHLVQKCFSCYYCTYLVNCLFLYVKTRYYYFEIKLILHEMFHGVYFFFLLVLFDFCSSLHFKCWPSIATSKWCTLYVC